MSTLFWVIIEAPGIKHFRSGFNCAWQRFVTFMYFWVNIAAIFSDSIPPPIPENPCRGTATLGGLPLQMQSHLSNTNNNTRRARLFHTSSSSTSISAPPPRGAREFQAVSAVVSNGFPPPKRSNPAERTPKTQAVSPAAARPTTAAVRPPAKAAAPHPSAPGVHVAAACVCRHLLLPHGLKVEELPPVGGVLRMSHHAASYVPRVHPA